MFKQTLDAQFIRTTFDKLVRNQSTKIYIKADLDRIYGFLVIKQKDYPNILHDENNSKLVYLIDFFVHESVQRTGVGKLLFERMLKTEKIDPFQIA